MDAKKTILIIEQECNLVNGLRRMLEKEGYDVVSIFNHYHLEEIFCDKKPDLAIINISSPKEFGLNILRKTKEAFPSLPIIAMTVYTNTLNRRELNRLGASDFIGKPFDVECLKGRIEELIDNKK
jgi:two-component system NtrC family response regulator